MTTHPGTFKFQHGQIVRHFYTKMNYLVVGVWEHPEYGILYDIEDPVGNIYQVKEDVLDEF